MPDIIDDARRSYDAWRQERWAQAAGPDGLAGLVTARPVMAPDQVVPGVPGRWSPGPAPGTVTVAAGPEDEIVADGQRVTGEAEFDAGSRIRLSGDRRVSVVLDAGITMLTVWDPAAPTRTRLRGISAYPFDPAWVVEADYRAATAGRSFRTNRLAQDAEVLAAPADVTFDLGGERRSLVVLSFHGGLHVGFTDLTTGTDSSPNGRWLPLPGSPDHRVRLDFNQAIVDNHEISPVFPCFLPLPQNHLPLAVTAGERRPVYRD